jgi:hypothetical protein
VLSSPIFRRNFNQRSMSTWKFLRDEIGLEQRNLHGGCLHTSVAIDLRTNSLYPRGILPLYFLYHDKNREPCFANH